jgi:ribonuclease HII
MARGLVAFDRTRLGGAGELVGVDEAGRGCLAGPVVAAAVRCGRAFYESPGCGAHCRGVDDSKRLDAGQRAAIVKRFRRPCHQKWIQIGMGAAEVEEIERFNIFQATVLAMRRACEALGLVEEAPEGLLHSRQRPARRVPILVDGRPLRTFPLAHEGIVGGDRRSFAIALAGIHAKEWRDELMRGLHREHPAYGFGRHKGYGTPEHREALRVHGPTDQHRRLFLRSLEAGPEAVENMTQDSLFRE